MAKDSVPPRERVASSIKQLSTASKDLEIVANQLSGYICSIERILEHLNLRVPAWYEMAGRKDGDYYWSRDVGYAEIDHKWRIAIRTTEGWHGSDQHSQECWVFNDAPRWMCIDAISKLPDLIDDLTKKTVDTTAKLRKKTVEAAEIASGLSEGLRAPEAK